MKYGISIFPTDQSLRIDHLARACEARGFASVFVSEHSHIPASRRTPWPVSGAPLPRDYWAMFDPLVALAMAAGVTERLLLGTAICLVVQRDPIILAKETASLDHLSDGRFIFGIGSGWNAEEMENHGASYAHRWDITREKTEAIKAIWTDQAAAYHGRWVDFDPIWCEPKPMRKPHPPILFGGQSAKGMRAALTYCNGWLPVVTPGLAQDLARFRLIAEEVERDLAGLDVIAIWGDPVAGWPAPSAEVLDEVAALGIGHLICGAPPTGGYDGTMAWLDQYAAAARL